MNEQIAKLYDQAIVIEDGGDYVTGELDPVKFAQLIVLECLNRIEIESEQYAEPTWAIEIVNDIKEHFGV
jgi:hypothetical protein